MKKCPKCNADLADDAVFCKECGEKLDAPVADKKADTEAPAAANETLENAQTQAKNKQIGMIAVAGAAAVVVLILLVVLISSLSGGYKKPIKTVVNNLNKRNTNIGAYLDCFAPKSVTNYYDALYGAVKSGNKDAIEDLNDAVEDMFDEAFDNLEDEYGDNVKIKIESIKGKKMSRGDLKDAEKRWSNLSDTLENLEIDDDDLYDQLSEMLDDEYSKELSEGQISKLAKEGDKLINALDDIKVTAGYEVTAKIKVVGSDDDDTEKIEFNVIKVNGKWFIDGSVYSYMVTNELNYIF